MKYSQATNYALHTMLHLVALHNHSNTSVQQLAELQNLSPTYLSKILTKLVKAGLIESTPGIRGGYRLRKEKADVSFLDVIQAIEGTASFFHCEVTAAHKGCLIQKTMTTAEQQMETYLQSQKLIKLVDQFVTHNTTDKTVKNNHRP
ncbi:MAG: Rrf2 family transcriptional regulator [Chloroflexota bacterium]